MATHPVRQRACSEWARALLPPRDLNPPRRAAEHPARPLPASLQSERRDQFDRVVIETTGLANPAPIIQTFFLEPSVADSMKLDGVVTLVRGLAERQGRSKCWFWRVWFRSC